MCVWSSGVYVCVFVQCNQQQYTCAFLTVIRVCILVCFWDSRMLIYVWGCQTFECVCVCWWKCGEARGCTSISAVTGCWNLVKILLYFKCITMAFIFSLGWCHNTIRHQQQHLAQSQVTATWTHTNTHGQIHTHTRKSLCHTKILSNTQTHTVKQRAEVTNIWKF